MIVSKEVLKAEIDKVQDEYLDALYRIIKAFEYPPDPVYIEKLEEDKTPTQQSRSEWLDFVDQTYGCLADNPIQRGEQGAYEIREAIE